MVHYVPSVKRVRRTLFHHVLYVATLAYRYHVVLVRYSMAVI